MVERYLFFQYEKEIQVEKTSHNNFKLTYYGKSPKLYNINLNDVLISPGDSIELTYYRTEAGVGALADSIVAKGNNSGNYIFSNYITPMKPLTSYPDHKLSKYQNNFHLLAKTLDEINKKDLASLEATLNKHIDNKEVVEYFKRKMRLNLFYDLLYFKNKYTQPSQLKIANGAIDSVFMHNTYVKSDTAHGYFMELAFKNYFDKIIIPKFNGLKSDSDIESIVNYISSYADPFIASYFTYFLTTYHSNAILQYQSAEFDRLISENPHIGKERNKVLNRENIYK